MLQGIHWLGHASFRLENGLTVYVDPWKLDAPGQADLILVTHGHHDHYSPEDIRRIVTPDTVIYCPASCADELSDEVAAEVRAIAVGEGARVGDAAIEAVASYNTDKPNHPQEAGNVGYIVEMGGRRIYHAGDTDLIPEMGEIDCDVALLPVGGTYTMNAKEAAEAVKRIMPRVAVPMHYGEIVGAASDAQRFKRLVPADVQVVILEAE